MAWGLKFPEKKTRVLTLYGAKQVQCFPLICALFDRWFGPLPNYPSETHQYLGIQFTSTAEIPHIIEAFWSEQRLLCLPTEFDQFSESHHREENGNGEASGGVRIAAESTGRPGTVDRRLRIAEVITYTTDIDAWWGGDTGRVILTSVISSVRHVR